MSKSLKTRGEPEVRFISSDEWVSVDEVLETDNAIGAISLGEENYIYEGEERSVENESMYFGRAEELKGDYMVLNNVLVDPIEEQVSGGFPEVLVSEERNDAGFYIGNSMGSPTEVKLDHDLPDKEMWHTHTGYEIYKPIGGEIELGLGDYSFLENFSGSGQIDPGSYTTQTVTEDDYFAVPPNVPHKVVDREDPSLLIVRYPEEGEVIDKYFPDGTPAYPWSDEKDFRIEPYEPEE